MGIPFLGKIPIDPAVVTAGDAGKPYVLNTDNGVAAKAFNELIDKIISMSK